MQSIYVSYVSLFLSMAMTLVAIGIAWGILKGKIRSLEEKVINKEIVINDMGKRIDKDIRELKSDYIVQMSNRLKDDEKDLRGISEKVIRLDARITVKLDMLHEKLDKVEAKLT